MFGRELNFTLVFMFCFSLIGSLPPSPADSGVSDVDPSSLHNSDDENRPHRRHPHAAMGKTTVCLHTYFSTMIMHKQNKKNQNIYIVL